MKTTKLKNLISEQRNRYRDTDLLTIVDQATDALENIKSNMATNSVLRRSEKMGYLQAFDELLDMLSDIGYYYEMEHDKPVDESAKPDFLDLDGDGDTAEPMKQAARDAVTESRLITKGGLQQLREVPLSDRIRKNLIGNN